MRCRILALVVILLLSSVEARADWGPWTQLVGKWVSEGNDARGQVRATTTFEPDLQDRVLVRRNHNEYGEGKVHEDLMVVHRNGEAYAAEYYDNEGHFIQYDGVVEAERIVLTSREGPGPRFRLTIEPRGKDAFYTKFEIQMPGQAFKTYLEGESHRAPHP